ncbi:MAG: hypothetical protein FWE98_00210 [Oscillospiraceae bacterium]|nr:hypothetical protein [Oscillospiraceae bacterium]
MKSTREEALILDQADQEIKQHGKTNLKCPRCGGGFAYDGNDTTYTFHCVIPGCTSITFRGL